MQIVKPGYNDVLKGTYRILIAVTARKYNPQSIEMFIDDKSASDGPMPISSFASSSYDFDTNKLSEGRHKLTVRVTDSQGFRGWSETTVFVNNKGLVDSDAPDLKWVGVKPFQEFSGEVTFEVNASDNFGVKLIHISLSPADKPKEPVASVVMNQPPYRIKVDTVGRNLPDGLYVLKALAYDSLEQQGDAPPLTIGIVNNQINATRIEDMLDGKRQMAQILAESAPKTTAPAKTDSAQTATATDKTGASNATAPTTQSAPASDYATAPVATAPNMTTAPAPLPLQTPTHPGIQLPRVTLPQATAPDATPDATEGVIATRGASETRPAPVPQTEGAPTVAGAEPIPTPDAPNSPLNLTIPGDFAPDAPTDLNGSNAENSADINAAPAANPTAAANVVAPTAPPEKTRLAKAPSVPIGQRNASQASLSRAAAIDARLAETSKPVEVSAAMLRAAHPIAIARFAAPGLPARAVTGAPAWSQNASADDSRLSNAERGRARAWQSQVKTAGVSQPLEAPTFAPRALQMSAPAAAQRSLQTPASRLTRQAQSQAQSQTAPRANSISKAVAVGGRPAPIEIAPGSNAAPQLSAPVAPGLTQAAPQMSAPSRLAKAVQSLTRRQTVAAEAAAKTEGRNGERIAALPRPDAATGNRSDPARAAIVAVPLDQSLQIADAAFVPTSYRVERATTLRAVAARFGLPVELVALSNGWASEMKVLPGMEVKLPRPLQVSYNGAPVTGDAPSMLMNDTAVTAFRFMFEQSGGKLEWDAAHQRVVARKGDQEIVLTIGSNVAKVGDREVMMELAAFLFQGRTMVPLRFFEEGLNAQVEWNPQTGRIVVAMAG